MLTFGWFLLHSELKIIFPIKAQSLIIRNFSKYINLFILPVVLVILAKPVGILKVGWSRISKKITSLIFLNI